MTKCHKGKGASVRFLATNLLRRCLSSRSPEFRVALLLLAAQTKIVTRNSQTRIRPDPEEIIALASLQLHPRHLTRARFRVLNVHTEKFSFKISVPSKKFRANMRHVRVYENLFHHDNRAQYDWRIPQYTKCSNSSSVKAIINRRPQPAAGTPRRGISYLCQSLQHFPPIRGCAFSMRWKKRSIGTLTIPG